MGIFNYTNPQYSGSPSIPIAVGDRHYAQDLFRDHRYYQEQLGLLYSRIFGLNEVILSGLVCSQGAGHTLNVTAGSAIGNFSVELPHRTTTWAIPPSTENDDVVILIRIPSNLTNQAISSAVTDGVTTNYIKLAYTESDGNTRARAKKTGSYAYEVEPDYTLTVDDTTPTAYEVVLETFTSDGATLTFLGNEDYRLNKELNEYNSIDILGETTETKYLQIGYGRSGNGQSHIDLVGDTTYTDYGLRIIRNAGGANTGSYIQHRGTGYLELICTDSGKIRFSTANIGRLTIDETGDIIVQDSGTAKLCVGTGKDLQIYSSSDDVYFDQITLNKDMIFRVNDGGSMKEIMRFDADVPYCYFSNCKIGIGTTTPIGKLDIQNGIIKNDDSATDVSDYWSSNGIFIGDGLSECLGLLGTQGGYNLTICYNHYRDSSGNLKLLDINSSTDICSIYFTNIGSVQIRAESGVSDGRADENAATRFEIMPDGGVFAYSMLQQSAAGLVVEYDTSTKEIYAETCCLESKTNIRKITGKESKIIYQMKPVIFDSIFGKKEKDRIDYIADYLVDIAPNLVVYSNDFDNEGNLIPGTKKIAGYNKMAMIPLIGMELNEHEEKLNKILKRLEKLEGKLNK